METLDLTKILKDMPKGTKLYSTIHGVVTFERVHNTSKTICDFPIEVILKNDNTVSFTSEGLYFDHFDGECILFPSKENRDWSTFKIPEKKFDI